MSYRKLGVLLDGLPVESRLRVRMRNTAPPPDPTELSTEAGEYGPWTLTDYLLAHLVDMIAMQRYENSDRKSPPPKPYPRPGLDDAKVKPVNPRMFEYLEGLRERHGAAEGEAVPTTE